MNLVMKQAEKAYALLIERYYKSELSMKGLRTTLIKYGCHSVQQQCYTSTHIWTISSFDRKFIYRRYCTKLSDTEFMGVR